MSSFTTILKNISTISQDGRSFDLGISLLNYQLLKSHETSKSTVTVNRITIDGLTGKNRDNYYSITLSCGVEFNCIPGFYLKNIGKFKKSLTDVCLKTVNVGDLVATTTEHNKINSSHLCVGKVVVVGSTMMKVQYYSSDGIPSCTGWRYPSQVVKV